MRLSLEQETAIDLCCDTSNRIVGITGGAGTGKTLVLGKAYSKLCVTHKPVLCAPTGRAAKRISELTGIEAKTVHRLLGFPLPDEEGTPGQPKYDRKNPLPYQVVFVDEASMVDNKLYNYLLDALPSNGSIRFFGDNNQLPPVEGASPFAELLISKPSITLTHNYRSDDEVISNALRILRGSIPVRNKRFEIIYTNDILSEVIDASPQFLNANNQIIIPTKKGKIGTNIVNKEVQRRFNKHLEYLDLDRADEKALPLRMRAHDKYLWIKNDYQLNIFNGTTGRVTRVDPEDGSLLLDGELLVPARVKAYNNYYQSVIIYDPRKQIELGYAVTTHKAQGSEFDEVIYCVGRAHSFMLNRRNFYTAITRARHKVYVICDRSGMSQSTRSYQG